MDRTTYMKQYRTAYKARSKFVTITLSRDQYSALKLRAQSEGVSPTTLAKQYVLNGLAQDPSATNAVANELGALEHQVRPIATTLNMLAHHANTVKRVVDVPSIFAELMRLSTVVHAFTSGRMKSSRASKNDTHRDGI